VRLSLTRKTDLALRVLRVLASTSNGDSHTASSLATALGASAAYLPQVMSPLVRAGWVGSAAGPHGGYRLLTPAAGISLLDLIQVIEGPVDDGRCVVVGTSCSSEEPCDLHVHWTRAKEALLAELRGIAIYDGPDPPGSGPSPVIRSHRTEEVQP
jgi:Rrf2 family protein